MWNSGNDLSAACSHLLSGVDTIMSKVSVVYYSASVVIEHYTVHFCQLIYLLSLHRIILCALTSKLMKPQKFIHCETTSSHLLCLDHDHRDLSQQLCCWLLLLCSELVQQQSTATNKLMSYDELSCPHILSFISILSLPQRCSVCVGVIAGPSCTSSCCWSFKPQQPLDRSTLVRTHTHTPTQSPVINVGNACFCKPWIGLGTKNTWWGLAKDCAIAKNTARNVPTVSLKIP